jgi:hypothetical protein
MATSGTVYFLSHDSRLSKSPRKLVLVFLRLVLEPLSLSLPGLLVEPLSSSLPGLLLEPFPLSLPGESSPDDLPDELPLPCEPLPPSSLSSLPLFLPGLLSEPWEPLSLSPFD